MNRREFLIRTGAAAAALAAGAAWSAETAPKRPNIVFILADDLGYECIRANDGLSYRTPVLDGLAASGMRFRHCYAQPLCTPTRVKLMTGMSNARNYVRFGHMDWEQRTFANILRDAGYATCIVGKWQLGHGFEGPQHFGFDEYCLWQLTRRPGRYSNPGLEVAGKEVNYTRGEYGPDLVCNYLCDFIRRKRNQPFLAYYPMILTHAPFVPTPDSPDWDPKAVGEKGRSDPKHFPEMVAYMDKLVGRIVRQLDDLGLRENTLIFFTGDNGTARAITSKLGDRVVRGGKGLMTDAGTRVPLIVNRPGTIPGGRVCDDLVDMSDFLPTMCESAGVPVPKDRPQDGRSILPQLLGRKGNPREWIYMWYSQDGHTKIEEFARTHRYKLYRTGKLYDVESDPLEANPLNIKALDVEAQAAYALLQEALAEYKDVRPAALRRGGGPRVKEEEAPD